MLEFNNNFMSKNYTLCKKDGHWLGNTKAETPETAARTILEFGLMPHGKKLSGDVKVTQFDSTTYQVQYANEDCILKIVNEEGNTG